MWRTSEKGLARHKIAGAVIFSFICAITMAPVLFVLVGSIDLSQAGQPFRFGFDGWTSAFSNSKTVSAIGYSFFLSVRIPLAIAIAFPIAWILVREKVPFGGFIEKALWFGFFLPTVPLTMGWILLLDCNYGLVNQALVSTGLTTDPVFSIYSIGGIIWVHLTATTIPIMVILLKPAMAQIDGAYEEAARISGAGVLTCFARITLPLLMPAILTAFIAGLIRSLEVYEIEQLIGTPSNIHVYSTRIVDLINQQPPALAQAMALSSLFLFLLLLLAGLYQMYLNKIGSRPTLTGKGLRPQQNAGAAGRIASMVLLAYLFVAVALPLSLLVIGSFKDLFGYFTSDWTVSNWELVLTDQIFQRSIVLSLSLGLIVAIVGCAFYAGIAWVLVRSTLPARQILSVMIWLPWAIPGVVLGLALLTMFMNTPFLRALIGTAIPIIFALVLKDMPFGIQIISSSIRQISIDMEEAAAMSGATTRTTLRRIVLPLIAPTMTTVMLLTFVACMRDISTITLLSGPGLRTMSLLMFEYATSGKFESAAVVGVILAAFSLILTIIAFRVSDAMTVKQ